MTSTAWIKILTWTLGALGAPIAAWGQASPAPMQGAAPEAGQGPVLGVVLLIVALVVVVGVAVKLYDVKRNRDEEAFVLQAQLSDALLLEPSLAGYPVVASVTNSFWGPSLAMVTVSGSVPSVELRDMALRLVERLVVGVPGGAKIEDRVIVSPHMMTHAA